MAMLRGRCVFADVTNTPQATTPEMSGFHQKGGSLSMPPSYVSGRHAAPFAVALSGGNSASRGRGTPMTDKRVVTAPTKPMPLQACHSGMKRQPSHGAARAVPANQVRSTQPSPLKAVPVGPAKSHSGRSSRPGTAPPKLQLKHFMPGSGSASKVGRYMERGTPRDVLKEIVKEVRQGLEPTDNQQDRLFAKAEGKHVVPPAPECTPEPENTEPKGIGLKPPSSVVFRPRGAMQEDSEEAAMADLPSSPPEHCSHRRRQQDESLSREKISSVAAQGLSREKISSVAAHFEALRSRASCCSSDEQIDMVLSDLVDSVLLSCHRQSQRHLPSEIDLQARLSSTQRESILTWLVQACDIMRFHEVVLYSTVLTLDRYCAAAREPLPMDRMQKVLMAVICTVLKTCAVADEVCMPLRDLLVHLCRRQVQFEDILMMEHQVLQTLQFQVSAPSSLDFLDALCVPLVPGESTEGSPGRCLANFLLQLSLFNAPLHYRRPHAILAAAALYVAFCSIQVAPVLVISLLKDVCMTCPEITDVYNQVGECAVELQTMWIEFASVHGSRVPCLLRKFAPRHLPEAMLMTPPSNGLPHPAAFASLAWQLPPPGIVSSPAGSCRAFRYAA